MWTENSGFGITVSMLVDENGPIEVKVRDRNMTCFFLGGEKESVDLSFESIVALQGFVDLAQRAIAEMHQWEAEEAAGDDSRCSDTVLRAGDAL